MRIVQMCGKAPTKAGIPSIVGAERWVIGSAYPDIVAPDRIFDVHPVAFIQERRPEAWAWYHTLRCPIYLRERAQDMPQSETYPIAQVESCFGARGARAFSSSVDHMMALALMEDVDRIHLSGVRMNSLEEWVLQRECLGYWIGQADAMGIEVLTEPEAALCTPEIVYGFDERTGAVRAPGSFVMVQGVPQ